MEFEDTIMGISKYLLVFSVSKLNLLNCLINYHEVIPIALTHYVITPNETQLCLNFSS